MIETSLRSYLLAQTSITSLVGQRIYPMRLPQGATLPAITYQVVFGTSTYSHDGDEDLGRRRFQLDCWASTYADSMNVAEAVRAAINGHDGPMGSTAQVNGRVINILDLPEPELAIWRRMVEVQLWHQEAA